MRAKGAPPAGRLVRRRLGGTRKRERFVRMDLDERRCRTSAGRHRCNRGIATRLIPQALAGYALVAEVEQLRCDLLKRIPR